MLTISSVKPYSQNRYQRFGNLTQQIPVEITQETARTAHIDKALRDFIHGATHSEIMAAKRLIPHVQVLLEKLLADSNDISAIETLKTGTKTLESLKQYYTL